MHFDRCIYLVEHFGWTGGADIWTRRGHLRGHHHDSDHSRKSALEAKQVTNPFLDARRWLSLDSFMYVACAVAVIGMVCKWIGWMTSTFWLDRVGIWMMLPALIGAAIILFVFIPLVLLSSSRK